MWWTDNEIIHDVEVMKYMWRSYSEYMETPQEIVDAVVVRMSLESKKK